MIEDFHGIPPYSLSKDEKSALLLKELRQLTEWHRDHCTIYKNFLDAVGYRPENITSLEQISFVPIRAFKEMQLASIPDDEVFKIMKSSGTSGQKQSKIYLDKETAILQQKVLLRLLGDFVGHKRKPMLVVDTESIIRDRRLFTTRGATIMGLEFAARHMVFALDDNMNLRLDVVEDFLDKYGGEDFIIFGFTFMVWQHLFQALEQQNKYLDMSKGFLLTAGGWKKLVKEAVSNQKFKYAGRKICNIYRYVDHYGMAEQTGCIYAECEYGHLHASIYSDVIIRSYDDFSPCKFGEKGYIQLLSTLTRSYPGHSLLTEDEGIILGEDDCPCGRKGKYIKILGRVQNAEIRGCSDTYAATF